MRKQSCPKHRKQAERESSQCLCMKSDTCRSHELKRRVIMPEPFSDAEEDLFIKLHSLLGNRWSLIAARLPERTENEVKNYWNSCLKSKYTKIKKRRKTLTRDHTEVLSDAASVTRELNLDLSISMTSSSHFDAESTKVRGGTCDAALLDLETGNTRNRTLLLFQ